MTGTWEEKEPLFDPDIRLYVNVKPSTTELEKIRNELFMAVEDDNVDKVKQLINQLKEKYQKKITSKEACHPETNANIWHIALSNAKNEIVKYLRDNGDESLFMSYYNRNKAGTQGEHNTLHILIEKNDVDMVKTIFKKIISDRNKRKLMEQETSVDIQGQRPRLLSCLHLAAYYDRTDIVDILLDEGMEVDHNTEKGKKDTALLWAARWGHDKTVRRLLSGKASPNCQNDKGSTALHWAVRYEHETTVKVLLEEGMADPDTKRQLGLVEPLIVASAYGNNEIVGLLLDSIKKRGTDQCTSSKELSVHHAAKEGHHHVISALVRNGAHHDAQDKLGDTPLLLAAQNGHVNVVYKLIEQGANVFQRNHEGRDVFSYAIESENNVLLDKLLNACKDVGIDINSRQPLFIAADRGRCDKIDFLLQQNQDPFAVDSDGNTFLHYAALNNRHTVIKEFHDRIPIDTKNKRGNTLLHIACSKGYDQTVKTLLQCNANADLINKRKETALHAAALSTHLSADTVKQLLSYTHNKHTYKIFNAADCEGHNSLYVAGKYARPDVIKEFHSLSLNASDGDGKTPLHAAVRPGEPECLDVMLDIFESKMQDARINEQSKAKKETVLHLAAEAGLSTCVKRLIDLGADLAMRDVDGNTVLHRLTIETVKNPRYLKRHLEVVDIVLNGVVKWWCIKTCIPYPEEDNRSRYISLQKKATLYLINDVKNKRKGKDHLSVLALSFEVGAHDIISRLLMLPGITMFKPADRDKGYIFDLTQLTPRTNNALKGYRSYKVFPWDKDFPSDKVFPSDKKDGFMRSGLDCLITHSNKARAAQILDIPPMQVIENYYINIVAITFALLMLFHIVYMSIFTYVGVDLLGKLRDDESAINSSDPETLLLYIMVPIEPAIILIYEFYTLAITEDILRQYELSRKRGCAYVKLVISAFSPPLVAVVYAFLIIAWIVLFSIRYEYQDYVLAADLCIGWLLSISFTRGFKIIHYLYRMLLSMILRDVVRFIIVYIFVLLAFGFAFHVLFQVSSDVVQDYETPWDTLFLSFRLMAGMGELFDDNLTANMSGVGRNVTYLKLFYLLYIILSTIILVNLLIAMMNDSYSNILKKQQVTWRLDSVSLGVAIEKTFPASKIFANVFILQGHEAFTKFDTNRLDILASDRWYGNIDSAVVDEYMCRQDTGSETVADELKCRLEELENKTEQMQEKTKAKLQQISELLEKMAVHKS